MKKKIKDTKKENNIYKVFTILSLLLGFIFSILIPLYQVPDEETHINELYKFLGEETKFSEETLLYGDTIRIIRNYDEKVDIKEYIDFSQKLNVINGVKSISIYTIRYLPQTIGIIISEIFKLPVLVSVTLAEFLAVIFYTVIGIKTLKLMPIKKELMMMIMLLPICIQQIGSFSYDMMLLSLSFLLIAYIFNLKMNKEEVSNRDLIKLIIILLMITLIKVPYILLGLLIFIIPLNKITLLIKIKKVLNTKSKKIISVIAGIIISIIAIIVLSNVSYVKVLLAFITNPIEGLILIVRTLIEHLGFYVMSILGYFGWHDTPVSILFGVFIILGLLLTNICSSDSYEEKTLSKRDNIYLLTLGIFSCIIIVISLFEWTINYNGIDTTNFTILDYSSYINSMHDILGVQGRYFIPFMPLLIIPLDFKIEKFKNNNILKVIQIIYYLVLILYMFIIIINRYWI